MEQMNRSATFGVPEGLETTYDILGFPKCLCPTNESVTVVVAFYKYRVWLLFLILLKSY